MYPEHYHKETVLAANSSYIIRKDANLKKFTIYPPMEEWVDSYHLEQTGTGISLHFDTLEDLEEYALKNELKDIPEYGTVSWSLINKARRECDEFNKKTHNCVKVHINSDQERKCKAEISWCWEADVGPAIATQFSGWLKEAAELAKKFRFNGLTTNWPY